MPNPAIRCRRRFEALHFLLTGTQSTCSGTRAAMNLTAVAVLILSGGGK